MRKVYMNTCDPMLCIGEQFLTWVALYLRYMSCINMLIKPGLRFARVNSSKHL